jgi:hypothetical protein
MEKVKGFEYVLDGVADLGLFSQAILALVNIKSSRRETIADIRTIEGMNRVIVVAYEDLDKYFASNDHVWTVFDKEPVSIITEVEFSRDANKEFDRMLDNDESYFLHIAEY